MRSDETAQDQLALGADGVWTTYPLAHRKHGCAECKLGCASRKPTFVQEASS